MNRSSDPPTVDEVLVGIAVDVSSSMEESIQNQSGDQIKRFDSFQTALQRFADEAQEALRQQARRGSQSTVRVFIIGFGLREEAIEVADFLSLIRLKKKLASGPRSSRYDDFGDPFVELEHIARSHGRPGWGQRVKSNDIINRSEASKLVSRLRNYPSLAKKLADQLPDSELIERIADGGVWGAGTGFFSDPRGTFSDAANLGEDRRRIEKAEMLVRDFATASDSEFRQEIAKKLAESGLADELQQAGDTTLDIEDIRELLDDDSSSDEIEAFIYGRTPMKRALKTVGQRFQTELRGRDSERVAPVFFLLSDGEPTDGDPSPEAATLRSMGVTVISCFVTSKDLVEPRKLTCQPPRRWSEAAHLMFQMASSISDLDSTKFLQEQGWTIEPEAKLFIQVNHSDMLERFMQVILHPLR